MLSRVFVLHIVLLKQSRYFQLQYWKFLMLLMRLGLFHLPYYLMLQYGPLPLLYCMNDSSFMYVLEHWYSMQ